MGHEKNDPKPDNDTSSISQTNNTTNATFPTVRTSLKKERRKKVRRSVRKKPKDVTMYYCNINGFQSKKDSIRKIVDDLQPKIIALCELKLPGGNAVKSLFPEFEVSVKPTKAGKSGIAVGVKLQTFVSISDVTTSLLDDILSVRVCLGNETIRIILGYMSCPWSKFIWTRSKFRMD